MCEMFRESESFNAYTGTTRKLPVDRLRTREGSNENKNNEDASTLFNMDVVAKQICIRVVVQTTEQLFETRVRSLLSFTFAWPSRWNAEIYTPTRLVFRPI